MSYCATFSNNIRNNPGILRPTDWVVLQIFKPKRSGLFYSLFMPVRLKISPNGAQNLRSDLNVGQIMVEAPRKFINPPSLAHGAHGLKI